MNYREALVRRLSEVKQRNEIKTQVEKKYTAHIRATAELIMLPQLKEYADEARADLDKALHGFAEAVRARPPHALKELFREPEGSNDS